MALSSNALTLHEPLRQEMLEEDKKISGAPELKEAEEQKTPAASVNTNRVILDPTTGYSAQVSKVSRAI